MSAVFAPSLNTFPSDLSGDSQVAKLRVPPHSIEAESSVMMVGRGKYFDIYNSADYAKVNEIQKARVSESFGDLGIF